MDDIKTCHVLHITHHQGQCIGCCVSAQVNALNAFDAAVFLQAHGSYVADGRQIQIGTTGQPDRIETVATADAGFL